MDSRRVTLVPFASDDRRELNADIDCGDIGVVGDAIVVFTMI